MSEQFVFPTTVRHQKWVLAFALRKDTNEVYYNVLDLQVASSNDAFDWTGFTRLVLPGVVSPAGISLLDAQFATTITGQAAATPVQVVSDGQYLYLFQQSTVGTLYVSTFLLVQAAAAQGTERPVPTLEPAWEVRYKRSGNRDVGDEDGDSQSFLSPDGTPYLRPTIELSMIQGIAEGRFCVALTPANIAARARWQVFALDPDRAHIKLYTLLFSADRVVDLSDKLPSSDGLIAPDARFRLTLAGMDGASALTLITAPSTVFFNNQEATTDSTVLIKRNGRLMLALGTQSSAPASRPTALLEFTVAADGTLSRPPEVVETAPVDPLDYALLFKPQSKVSLSKTTLRPANFTLQAWVYPNDVTPESSWLIGGSETLPDTGQPAFLKLISGGYVVGGFGTGDALCAVQTQIRLVVGRWYQVALTFDGTSLKIYINAAPQRITTIGVDPAGQVPADQPIQLFGRQSGGFVGIIDEIAIWDVARTAAQIHASLYRRLTAPQPNLIGYWPMNNGQGSAIVDVSGQGNSGTLSGPAWVPSDSPVEPANVPRVYVDDRGLTLDAGVLPWLESNDAPFLMNGADGLIHLYFRSLSGLFSVAQYTTRSARSLFVTPWRAGSGSAAQSGYVQFIARRSGSALNDADIQLIANPVEVLVDASFGDGNDPWESWRGLPRHATRFVEILQGRAQTDVTASAVQNGTLAFYDYDGLYTQARLVIDSQSGSNIGFVTGQLNREQAPLTSVTITGNTALRDIQFEFRFKDAAANAPTIRQSWPGVPAALGEMTAVLRGFSSSYDYRVLRSDDTPVYAVQSTDGAVLLIGRPGTVNTLAARVSSAGEGKSQLCQLDITLNPGAGEIKATFKEVPRSENTFAAVLLGTDPSYDYASNASGAYQQVALDLVVIANGKPGEVLDQQLEPDQTGNLLAVTALVAMLSEGVLPDVLVPARKLDATVLQGIVLQPPSSLEHGQSGYLLRNVASGMLRHRQGQRSARLAPPMGPVAATFFNVLPVTLPTNGYPALLTSPASATLYQAGRLGGWLIEPQRYALSFGGANAVTVNTESAGFADLLIKDQLTLEAFVNTQPLASTSNGLRVLTMSSDRQSADQTESTRYLLGLDPSYFLQIANTASVSLPAAASIPLEGQTLTLQLWINPQLRSTTTQGAIFMLGATQLTESLAVKADGTLVYTTGDLVVTFAHPVADNTWVQISIVRSGTSVSCWLNGKLAGHGVVHALPVQIGAFTLANVHSPLEFGVNDCRFWNRALGQDEIASNWRRRVSVDADGLVFLWSLTQSAGRVVPNEAPTGTQYDGQIPSTSTPLWDRPGVYFALYGGAGTRLLRTTTAVVPRASWVQTALVYRSGCGLNFRGIDFADCGNNRSLNCGEAFSVSCWLHLPSGRGANSAVVLSKWGVAKKTWEYRLGVDPAGKVFFDVMTVGASAPFRIQSGTGIRDNRPHHIAAVLTTSFNPPTRAEDPTEYRLTLAVYVDGVETRRTEKSLTHALAVQTSAVAFNFGRQWPDAQGASIGAEQLYLTGQLSNVSLWSRQLSQTEVSNIAETRELPGNQDGLTSAWFFQEMSGKVAADVNDVNNARLNVNVLWTWFDATSRLRLLADGIAQAAEEVNATAVGGYGNSAQFSIGALQSGTAYSQGFVGQLDEIRVWRRELTNEQISDSLYRSLSGSEPGLAGYWSFDGNSGLIAYDLTVNGNNGKLEPSATPPSWTTSTAPLSNEAPEVINVLGGVMTDRVLTIDGSPAASEYADLQLDVSGQPFSVMKRAYVARTDATIDLISGFKVGDLTTRHLGQVQTEPTLIGYIEGAPPLPSENLTRPLYSTPTSSDYVGYATSSSLTLQQSAEIKYSFAAVKETGFDLSTDIHAGLFFNNEINAGSPFLMAQTTTLEGHVGVHGVVEFSKGTSTGSGNSVGRLATLSDQIVSGGGWEPADPAEWLNPAVGRRYVPSNFGYALVKSLTADVYASYLQSTGTLVALTTIPSPDIPEDVNVISFPMDPGYITAGSLDGKVGFVQDPSFLPSSKQQSYFKPIEAYRLKRQIERQTEQAAAYYRQFDAQNRGQGGDSDLAAQRDADPYYNWSSQVPRKSLVNTYVWTAGGGLHTEEESFTVTRTEDYSGKYQFSGKAGVDARAEAAFFVGFYLEFDFLIGGHTEITVSKGSEDSRFFGMSLELGADRFLKRWVGETADPAIPTMDGYSITNCPGKVRGYRFMSFYLAPDEANATQFMSVIDQNWLKNSGDPNAAALAAATGSGNGVWRVLHRTTFVNRVPPEYQNTPEQSLAPPVRAPANLPANSEIVELVRRQVRSAIGNLPPTAADIGNAVTQVIGPAIPDQPPPVLVAVLPWWSNFLVAAASFGNPAQPEFAAFRRNLLDYMLNLYAAEALQ